MTGKRQGENVIKKKESKYCLSLDNGSGMTREWIENGSRMKGEGRKKNSALSRGAGNEINTEFSLLVGDVISLTEIASTEHLLYEKSQST